MGASSVMTLLGLVLRLNVMVASGMQAFGAILAAYGAAIMASSGWRSGGAIAGFLFIMAAVCFVRGWWLREEEAARRKERRRIDNDNEAQAPDAPN